MPDSDKHNEKCSAHLNFCCVSEFWTSWEKWNWRRKHLFCGDYFHYNAFEETGEDQLKSLVRESTGNKTTLERIWNRHTSEPFPKIMKQSKELSEPTVWHIDDTALKKLSREKFNDVISMGDKLSDNMVATMPTTLNKMQQKQAVGSWTTVSS